MGRRLNPGHPWWRLNRHRRNPDAPARVASIPISNDASFVSAPPLFLSSLLLKLHTHCIAFSHTLHRSIQHSWSHSSLHLVALALLYTWSHFPNFLFHISSRFLPGWGAEFHSQVTHNPQPSFQQLVVTNPQLNYFTFKFKLSTQMCYLSSVCIKFRMCLNVCICVECAWI